MLEKIKYRLSDPDFIRQTRVRCIAAMTAFTIAVITLLGFSLNTVKVFDGEKTYTVRSVNANVANILSGLKLKSERYQIMKTKVENHLTTVEIAYSFPVFITVGDNTLEVEFTGGTVLDALTAAGLTPDEHDFVEPAVDTEVSDTVYIAYADIEYVDGSYTEVIPHTLETVYSAAKAAINAYSGALRCEVAPFGIDVCAVMPGDLKTGFTAAREKNVRGDAEYGGRISRSVSRMEHDEQTGMPPEKAAAFLCRVALRRRTKPLYAIGPQYSAAVLLSRLLPCRLVSWIVSRLYAA